MCSILGNTGSLNLTLPSQSVQARELETLHQLACSDCGGEGEREGERVTCTGTVNAEAALRQSWPN